jgi:hypothetical protein
MIAALFVAPDGVYAGLPGVEVWDEARDARRYAGPWPVVAHPPCQRWGRFWHGSPSRPHQFQPVMMAAALPRPWPQCGAGAGCWNIRPIVTHGASTGCWRHRDQVGGSLPTGKAAGPVTLSRGSTATQRARHRGCMPSYPAGIPRSAAGDCQVSRNRRGRAGGLTAPRK